MAKKLLSIIAILFLGPVLLAGGSAQAADPVRLTWTAGGTGGGWYVLAAGIAKIIKEKAPNIEISVIPGAGTQNQPIVGSNKVELGFGMPPFVVAALKGTDPYKEKYPDIRTIGGQFSVNYVHFLAAEDTGVKTIRGIFEYPKPIRVSPMKKGSSGEFTFRKVMEDYFHMT